jgi:NAD-dependent deacetylase
MNENSEQGKTMDDLIKKAARDLAGAKSVAALTGAGISVESGIPPFRGKGGIWETIDPMEYAHIDAFMEDPGKVWNVLLKGLKEIIEKAKPNDAHKGLAKLEKLGILKTIITQNIDGLHQTAGNTDVIEFHGNFAWHRCLACNKRCETPKIDLKEIPPRCECGGILRPEFVFFGEAIPSYSLMRSQEVASECDIMLVVGTSAIVQPAAFMPMIAKESGAKVIEINPEKTPLTARISDYLLMGQAGRIMNRLMEEVERLVEGPFREGN